MRGYLRTCGFSMRESPQAVSWDCGDQLKLSLGPSLEESMSHQAQYFDALAHTKRRSRRKPTLKMAEKVLADTKVDFSSRASAAGILVMTRAIAVAQPLFVGALKGWHPVTSLPESTDLSDRINAMIAGNSSSALTVANRLGRPGDGKRPA